MPRDEIREELPYSFEAEQQVLGMIMVENVAFDEIASFLSADHFYDPSHIEIFKTIRRLIEDGKAATAITVWNGLEGKNEIQSHLKQQVKDYFRHLTGVAFSSSMVKTYAEQIVDLANRRKLIEAVDKARAHLFDGKATDDVTAGIDEALIKVDPIGKPPTISARIAVMSAVERMSDLRVGEGTGGVPIGLQKLSERLGSWYNQDLILLGGRPSMGKTALATSMVIAAARAGYPVALVSAEMSEEAVTHRMLAEIAGIQYNLLRRPGALSEEEIHKIIAASEELAKLPIEIISEERDVDRLPSLCRRVRRIHGKLGLVVVDYLQRLTGQGKSPNDRIGYISGKLKDLAKDLDVPVIALSQLSRAVEGRDDKRPQLADLRESGQLEQDADVVLFVYREYYYLSRNKPAGEVDQIDWQADCAFHERKMQVITAKQRMGPVGSDMIGCDITTNQFWDLGEQVDDGEEEFDF